MIVFTNRMFSLYASLSRSFYTYITVIIPVIILILIIANCDSSYFSSIPILSFLYLLRLGEQVQSYANGLEGRLADAEVEVCVVVRCTVIL